MKQFAENMISTSRRHMYLLTCWQERDSLAGIQTWRFRIETPGSDQKRVFASLEDTMTWIDNVLQKDSPDEG